MAMFCLSPRGNDRGKDLRPFRGAAIQMNPKPSQPRPSRSAVWPLLLGGLLLLLPVLYVASYGPVLWLALRGYIAKETYNTLGATFYAPVRSVCNWSPA